MIGHHSFFQLLHLGKVIISNLESFFFGIDELEAFVERPIVFLHEVGDCNCSSSRFAVHGVNETALAHLHGFFDELENSVEGIIVFIEDLELFL